MSIKAFIIFVCFAFPAHAHWLLPFEKKRPISVVLVPAGDAHNPGRTIDDTTERAVCMKLAEQIKKLLEQHTIPLHVSLSRNTGQAVAALQTASFANRINADVVLSLSCYKPKNNRSCITVYRFSYQDELNIKQPDLSWCPYDKAHLQKSSITKEYSHKIVGSLKNNLVASDVQGPYAVPYKPLIGMQSPALGFECGIQSIQECNECARIIYLSIVELIDDITH